MKRNLKIPTKCVLLLFAVLFSFACSKNNNSGELKSINILEAEKSELNISEIAESIEYLPLAGDSVLATIMKVVHANGDYYVKDNKSKFLRFDKNGNLKNQIGRRGKGPGEYRYVSNFVVHPNGNVYISGGKEGKIMVFSPEGKFLRTFDISQKYVSNFEVFNDNFLLYFGPGAEHIPENMEIVDTNGTVLKTFTNQYKFERGKAILSFTGECIMYPLNGKLYFKEIFSDTLFYFDGEEKIPKIILNSGDNRFSPEARTKAIKDLSADPRNPSNALIESVIQRSLFESSRYLFYSYGFNKKGHILILDKKSGQQTEIDREVGIRNDLDGGPNITLKMNKNDNTILAWVDAFELKSHVASEAFKNSTPKYPEKKKELEELADSLSENDNPVLMLVKLKE
ncbi:6-bladed beta-propeller protein [Tangfeifania diversioriginum]|uniref:6-bladed beta-propeller protein n=1 Tax=Tangfeifania diversioriginum TaxID=1168035 RepID=A0A1M6NTR6_9BACT|nr:6-bladed beta-propeller [Tangfeifania diversioriginum]SHJ99012.1 6-bladed beta-propeller protein [Tangfeifania diversioriginum]